jgi:hypothetical protein
VVDISVARATSLTDKYVHITVHVLMIVSEGDGGVEIVWFQGQGLLLCGRDLMDLDSCVIIVGFGMLRLAKYRNGEDGCMQSGRRCSRNIEAFQYYSFRSSDLISLNFTCVASSRVALIFGWISWVLEITPSSPHQRQTNCDLATTDGFHCRSNASYPEPSTE